MWKLDVQSETHP